MIPQHHTQHYESKLPVQIDCHHCLLAALRFTKTNQDSSTGRPGECVLLLSFSKLTWNPHTLSPSSRIFLLRPAFPRSGAAYRRGELGPIRRPDFLISNHPCSCVGDPRTRVVAFSYILSFLFLLTRGAFSCLCFVLLSRGLCREPVPLAAAPYLVLSSFSLETLLFPRRCRRPQTQPQGSGVSGKQALFCIMLI